MNTRLKIYAILVSICLIFGCSKEKIYPDAPALIPQASSVKVSEGFFEIKKSSIVSVENESQAAIANLFFDQFNNKVGWKPSVQIGSGGSIVFKTSENVSSEAYELVSSPKSLTISAASNAGFFYGLQTLQQLLPKSFASNKIKADTRLVIPIIEIKDQPRFGWRGFMLDVSRHFYEKKYIKKILDQMAALKLNTFHWHLTDDQGWRIEIKKYPKLTELGAWRVDYNDNDWTHNRWWGRPKQQEGEEATYGGFYTQADIKEIIAYAAERQITIIPEIDVPGHAQAAITAYPEIACHPGPYYVATGGAFKDNTLCPGKEVTFEFMENVLNEVMDLFPSKYIHIGGDECNKSAWKKDPNCQKRMKIEGLKNEEELQSYFIKRMEKILNNRGRILIGWDEILEGGLAPKATVMTWRGEAGGIKAAKDGHPIIMTPSKFCYLDLKQGHTDHEPNFGYSQCLLSNCYNYNPIPESLKDQSHLVLGVQGNLWTESLPEWDMATYMIYPRLFAIAENGWSSQDNEDWNGFINRLYPNLEKLELQGIRYAKSAFNIWIDHSGNEENITIDLHMEANGLDIKYTLDGTDPTLDSETYTQAFDLNKTTLVKAASFNKDRMVGEVSEKKFYIHKAKKAKVQYHTPYLKNKNGGGDLALIDYNYGINWSIDSIWQAFKAPEVEFDLYFDELTEVQSVRMNFLQIAISGIYMPEEISVLGSKDGENFQELTKHSLTEYSKVQGRYIQRPEINFPKSNIKVLKIKMKTVSSIYPGHHLEGQQSKLYIDEVIVE